MAFSTLLRRAAVAATPAVRCLTSSGVTSRRPVAAFLLRPLALALYSSSAVAAKKNPAECSLLRALEEEIKYERDCSDDDSAREIPEGFPFKITDESGLNIITMKRTFGRETIEVVVSMPQVGSAADEPEQDEATADDNADDKEESKDGDDLNEEERTTPFSVLVSKSADGPVLEFSCTAYPDAFEIDAVMLRDSSEAVAEEMAPYDGPDYNGLDENLQNAFHEYLETRGITTETVNFINTYMTHKDTREYRSWLENMKKFVQS